jgi:hypothetical protein
VDKYLELFDKIDSEGISELEFDWLVNEARNRNDRAREILLLICIEEEDRALDLAKALGADKTLIDGLAKWVNSDTAWHILFTIAETSPLAFQKVDTAIRHWSDESRLMPQTWWEAIIDGNYAPYHRLVRQLVIEEEGSSVILDRDAAISLGALTGLGLRAIQEDRLEDILKLDWLGNLEELHLIDISQVPTTFAETSAFPNVRSLVLQGCIATPEVIADLLVGTSFPLLDRLTLSTIQSNQPSSRAFAEQVIANPLELDRIAIAIQGRTVCRKRFDLVLKGLGVDSIGIEALAKEPALAGIRGLSFQFSVLSAHDIAILATLTHPFELFELHLGSLGLQGALELAKASWLATLRHLFLPNQNVGDLAMAKIVRRLDGGSIETLILRYNNLGMETAQALASVSLPNLKQLELSYNNDLNDTALAAIIANQTPCELEVLELLGTGVSARSTEQIATAEHLIKLRILNLGDEVGDNAAANLVDARLPSLERLQICGVSNELLSILQQLCPFVTDARFA